MTNTTVAPSLQRNGTHPSILGHMFVEVNGRLLTISVELVGPVEAEALLAKNTHNRNEKANHQARLTGDLVADEFAFNGDTIVISHEPEVLLDGQNRLRAIAAAGVTVPLLIIRGLPHVVQEKIDVGGVPRGLHDILKLRGETQCANLAALIRRCAAWDAGARRNLIQWTTTSTQLLHYYEKNPTLRDLVGPASSVARSCAMPSSSVGALWWAFSAIDTEDADYFFNRLSDGQGLVKGDALFELRRVLASERLAGGNGLAIKQIAITIKAWNAYRAGTTVGLLKWSAGGAKPEKFPEPV